MCRVCGHASPEFVKLNSTMDCSDIEISVSSIGLLRARNFRGSINPTNNPNLPTFNQDVVEINFCPICGRQFMHRSNTNIHN